MVDTMLDQLVNELRAILKPINEKYKDVCHVKLLTMVDMKDESCDKCTQMGRACLRCVIGFGEL